MLADHCDRLRNSRGISTAIENLNHNKMLDPLGQAWQHGSALAIYKSGGRPF